MQFTYIDAIVAAVTLLSGFLAYSRGFTREVFAIGGWILAAVVAFYLAPPVAPLVAEIPWLGQRLADSCLILMIVAFSLCVAAALLILAVFTPIFASVILESALGPIDRVLGVRHRPCSWWRWPISRTKALPGRRRSRRWRTRRSAASSTRRPR